MELLLISDTERMYDIFQDSSCLWNSVRIKYIRGESDVTESWRLEELWNSEIRSLLSSRHGRGVENHVECPENWWIFESTYAQMWSRTASLVSCVHSVYPQIATTEFSLGTKKCILSENGKSSRCTGWNSTENPQGLKFLWWRHQGIFL